MSCEFEVSLTGYVDDELAPMEKRRVEVHLGTCAACRATTNTLRNTVAKISAMPIPMPSSDLRRRVLAAVEELPPPGQPFWKRVLKPWLVVPGLVAVAASIVAITVTRLPEPPGGEFEDGTQLELAMQLTAAEELDREMLENFDLIGLESPEDLEVIANLHVLEEAR